MRRLHASVGDKGPPRARVRAAGMDRSPGRALHVHGRGGCDGAGLRCACAPVGEQGHYLLGLRILNTLVTEFNQPTAGRTMTQHRKLAVAFRDGGLLKVFQIAVAALQLLQGTAAGADDKLREQVGALWWLHAAKRWPRTERSVCMPARSRQAPGGMPLCSEAAVTARSRELPDGASAGGVAGAAVPVVRLRGHLLGRVLRGPRHHPGLASQSLSLLHPRHTLLCCNAVGWIVCCCGRK